MTGGVIPYDFLHTKKTGGEAMPLSWLSRSAAFCQACARVDPDQRALVGTLEARYYQHHDSNQHLFGPLEVGAGPRMAHVRGEEGRR